MADSRWLLLIHQLPPKPNYFRVKIWRRLQRLGAVGIKNSVYALPRSDQAQEDFQWVVREIVAGGGDASVCEASFVEGLSDEQVEAMFHAARDAEYAALLEEARRIGAGLPVRGRLSAEQRGPLETDLARLRRRLAEIVALDVLGAPGREAAEEAIAELETRLTPTGEAAPAGGPQLSPAEARGRVWVTRKGIHVDRMASAWLIRRFIDPEARFKYVAGRGYRPEPQELRFDMFEAEFTHEGDRCTFEVLIERFGLDDHGLRPLAEIIHDIDLRDAKFGRPEADGIDRLVDGITVAHKDDDERLERGAAVFSDLYEYFRRQRAPRKE